MRYMFGLVSLLVTVAIIMYLFSVTAIPTARKGKQVEEQLQPITGKTADGVTASDSVKVDTQSTGGKSLLVTEVKPGGYFEQYYGLKKGDKVVQIGDVDVETIGAYNADGLLGQLEGKPITVLREGKKIVLNASDGTLHTGGLQGVNGIAIPGQ